VNRKYGKPFRVSRRVPLASLLEIKKKKEERRKEGRKERPVYYRTLSISVIICHGC
jgi:hypothetical protein